MSSEIAVVLARMCATKMKPSEAARQKNLLPNLFLTLTRIHRSIRVLQWSTFRFLTNHSSP